MNRIIAAFVLVPLIQITASAQTSACFNDPTIFGPIFSPGHVLGTADMTNAKPLIPQDIARTAPRPDLATFAWLEFISAVSPVSGQRGVTGGSFGQSGMSPTTTLVWETYQHRTELLRYNAAGKGVPPNPWNAAPKYEAYYTDKNNKNVPYSPAFSNYNNLDEASQIGQNLLFFPGIGGISYQALFEAKANQCESKFVQGNPQITVPFTLPAGTFEVKAAWKPIDSIPQGQRARYHTATVITYSGSDDNPVAQTATYALVALHLIHKTPNFPSFIFATFEHVDDCDPDPATTVCKSGIFYQPQYGAVAYTTPATSDKKFKYITPPGRPNPSINFNVNMPTAKADTGKVTNLPLGKVGPRVPVTQPVPTEPDISAVNGKALAAMKGIPGFGAGFVWQYYKLVGVQSVPSGDDSTKDFYLANIVVESSQPGIQLFRGFPDLQVTPGTLTNVRNQLNVHDFGSSPATYTSSGGCQGCHGVAQTQQGFDFSFLFFGRDGTGFSPETIAPISAAQQAIAPVNPGQALARLKKRGYF